MKWLGWALAIFAVYYLATQPAQAATFVHHALSWAQHTAASLGTFVSSL